MAMKDQIMVFWVLMPCDVAGHQRFGGPCCLQLHGEGTGSRVELSYFATDNYSVIQSVLVSDNSVIPNQILAEGKAVTELMSWVVFPDGRIGLPSSPDPLPVSSSLAPLWSLLYSTPYWSLHQLTL